jgi:hypothetical protein
MLAIGSPPIDRLLAAINAHDPQAMTKCLDEAYCSDQPLHPATGFSGRGQMATNSASMFEEVPDLRIEVLRAAVSGAEASPERLWLPAAWRDFVQLRF